MDTGGLAQMSLNGFPSSMGLGAPTGDLACRRGSTVKPLSMDALKSPTDNKDAGVPTPRTSRSHLLAGLRTAPKSSTATNFPASPTTSAPASQQMFGRNVASPMYNGRENTYNGPKTSVPRMTTHQQSYNQMMGINQEYTAEQILAPPELHLDEQIQEQMDPQMYAQLVATNMYLAQQQQRLQQQLLQIQAAAQQFQGLSLTGQASIQQQIALQSLYQQQQQLKNQLQQTMVSSMQQQQLPQNVYAYYDPVTGQQYYLDQNQAQQLNQINNVYMEQPSTPQSFGFLQNNSTPRVQVSPPPSENEKPAFRTSTPPKKMDMIVDPTPLPPPSANAFRRGHKKNGSLANKSFSGSLLDSPKAAGSMTAGMPLSPLPNGYGPGQARAGEHPVRQPRGPPSIDELRSKPTAKHEGSKNFAARTRRSAVSNLVRAGMTRRKGTGSSSGSMSPVSESAEEAGGALTDNESDSGRSGSGSLSGDAEPSLASSRTSASGSWGAIGSDRPGSRQKSRKSVDSLSSACESDHGSFANVFKHGGQRQASKPESPDGQRKTPMLVLTSVEKRKGGMAA